MSAAVYGTKLKNVELANTARRGASFKAEASVVLRTRVKVSFSLDGTLSVKQYLAVDTAMSAAVWRQKLVTAMELRRMGSVNCHKKRRKEEKRKINAPFCKQ
jgi:hypothetical protein